MNIQVSDILNTISFDKTYSTYLTIFIVSSITFVILEIIKILSIRKIRNLAEQTKTDIDNLTLKIIKGFDVIFIIFLSIFITLQFINLDDQVKNALNKSSLVIIILYITKAIINTISITFNATFFKNTKNKDFDPTILKIFTNIVKFTFWIIAIAVILQNFGYNVSALIGGLGIAGIAIAFGLKSILEDIFAFFSLYLDKPFQVGDFIEIDNDEKGTVKKIGLKSTRLKTFYGEHLIISNKKLTQTTIKNYNSIKTRNISFKLNLDYRNSIEKINLAKKIIENAIQNQEKAEFKRAVISELADLAIKLTITYKLQPMPFVDYVETKDKIFSNILTEFAKHKIILKEINFKL